MTLVQNMKPYSNKYWFDEAYHMDALREQTDVGSNDECMKHIRTALRHNSKPQGVLPAATRKGLRKSKNRTKYAKLVAKQ